MFSNGFHMNISDCHILICYHVILNMLRQIWSPRQRPQHRNYKYFFFNCEPDRLCSILDTIQPIFPLRFVFEGKKMTLMLSNFLSHFIRLSIQRESMLPKMKNCPIDWPSSARLFRHEYSTFSAHFDDKYPFNEYTPILCVRIFFVLFRCLML